MSEERYFVSEAGGEICEITESGCVSLDECEVVAVLNRMDGDGRLLSKLVSSLTIALRLEEAKK